MGKIKFTKNELKKQQDAQKQFERFLPTLLLKKQQLQAEVRKSSDQLEANLASQRELAVRVAALLALFGPERDCDFVEKLVKIKQVKRGEGNIAGIAIPTFDEVVFETLTWDFFTTDWFVDDAVAALREAVSLREANKILQEQYTLISNELRTTSQRVNLFEKVKIPECRENIRRIRIMMGDLDISAVARSKIAKRKVAATA